MKLKRGRPHVYVDAVRVKVPVPRKLYERAAAIGRATGRSVAGVLFEVITRGLPKMRAPR